MNSLASNEDRGGSPSTVTLFIKGIDEPIVRGWVGSIVESGNLWWTVNRIYGECVAPPMVKFRTVEIESILGLNAFKAMELKSPYPEVTITIEPVYESTDQIYMVDGCPQYEKKISLERLEGRWVSLAVHYRPSVGIATDGILFNRDDYWMVGTGAFKVGSVSKIAGNHISIEVQ